MTGSRCFVRGRIDRAAEIAPAIGQAIASAIGQGTAVAIAPGDRGGNRPGTADRAKGGGDRAKGGGDRAKAAKGGGDRAKAANRGGSAARGGAMNVSSGRAAAAQSARGRASMASMGPRGGGASLAGGGGAALAAAAWRWRRLPRRRWRWWLPWGGGGGRRSDIELKHDVVLLGHLANGLGYYRFSYLGSSKPYVGVIAQEVQSLMPEAVTRGRDGYLRVYYEQLGLKFRYLHRLACRRRKDSHATGGLAMIMLDIALSRSFGGSRRNRGSGAADFGVSGAAGLSLAGGRCGGFGCGGQDRHEERHSEGPRQGAGGHCRVRR